MRTSGRALPRVVAVALLSLASVSAAPVPATFAGVITDSECAEGNHAGMGMGANDAECVRACIDSHGASFVLYDGTRSYALSDQRAPQRFAGRKVRVVGTLVQNGTAIQVESIAEPQ